MYFSLSSAMALHMVKKWTLSSGKSASQSLHVSCWVNFILLATASSGYTSVRRRVFMFALVTCLGFLMFSTEL